MRGPPTPSDMTRASDPNFATELARAPTCGAVGLVVRYSTCAGIFRHPASCRAVDGASS
jgi:hypothetical protein